MLIYYSTYILIFKKFRLNIAIQLSIILTNFEDKLLSIEDTILIILSRMEIKWLNKQK